MFEISIFILYLVFLSIHFIISSTINDDELKMMKSYIQLKYLDYVSIIGCFDEYDKLLIAKSSFENFNLVSVISLKGYEAETILPSKFHGGVILHAGCKDVEGFLQKSGEANLFDIEHHWLIFGCNSSITRVLSRIQLTLDSDVYVLLPSSAQKNEYFDVLDVYNPGFHNGGKLRKRIIGKYNNKLGFQLDERGLKYTERRDMSDVELKATITLPVNFSLPLTEYLHYDRQREINTFNRFHCKLIFFCQDYYNFSMKDIQVTKSWGYLLPNNSFDGLVGQLERNETDISLSSLFFRSDRLQKIDFGRRTWIMKVAFIFRNPKVPPSFTIFLKPLSFSIWLTTLGISMVSIFLYKLISKRETDHVANMKTVTWSELILFICGTFCQQGTTLNSTLLCGRIVILFAFILSLLIYQFYSASIVSFLLMKPPTPIKTPEDLLNSQMECRSEDILYNKDYFNRANDKTSMDIFYIKLHGDKGYDHFLTPEQGLNLVSKGGYAFNVELATAYPIIERTFQEDTICELKEVQLMRALQMFSSFQKGSSFRKAMNVRLQRFAEVGILDREIKHWLPRKPVCLDKLSSSKFTVGMIDMYPAFVMLFFGLVLTYGIYLIEVGFNRYHSQSGLLKKVQFPFTN